MPGIKASQPSRPKRFSLVHFEATKRSKESDQIKRSKMTRFSSGVYEKRLGTSKRARSQSHCFRSGMCVYSMPMLPPKRVKKAI